jgi:hypothetical protein
MNTLGLADASAFVAVLAAGAGVRATAGGLAGVGPAGDAGGRGRPRGWPLDCGEPRPAVELGRGQRIRVQGVDGPHLDEARALGREPQLGGGYPGKVDHAVADERAAVRDPHHDAAAVIEVRHPCVRGERKLLVRGGHGEHVVGLAIGRALAVEVLAVPGGDAGLDEPLARRQYRVPLPEHLVARGVAVPAVRLDPRDRVGDAVGVDVAAIGARGGG